MKTASLKLFSISVIFLFLAGMTINSMVLFAQDAEEDTVEVIQDNSSSFNDSVQFDDMEPIFYEATEEEAEPASENGSGIVLYVGIAIVLLIILIVLKRFGKKKP